MDINKYWFGSGSQKTQSIRLGRSCTNTQHRSYWPSSYDNAKPGVWQMLWRKIRFRRHKKKVFSSSVTMEGIYDPETYSKNFDQGMGWLEPDNLCRSFPARFAHPSRIFPPRHLLDS